ncbi:MerR family transcriptional regulator [Cyclobacteriaceae bacterium]|nr:MerR family transcriptional regulator [Cyclobacteriaceae bacterium]
MAQVEVLTGIKAHTLRIWERRFSFLNPSRTETNIRFYSDEQLIQLVNFGILLRNGHKISRVEKMSQDKIHDLVNQILALPDQDIDQKNIEDIQSLTLAMLAMDEIKFDEIFRVHVIRKGLLGAVRDLIYPFLHHIGILWNTQKSMPAQEHFISCLIRKKIISAIDAIPHPPVYAKKIVFFLLEDEHHELGILLASFIAAERGFKVYYLGQNVPGENIKEVLSIINADFMMSMFVVPKPDKTVKQIKKVLESTKIPFLISGNVQNFIPLMKNERVVYLQKPESLIDFLNENKGPDRH